MSLSLREKILLNRGFTMHDIETNFEEYKYDWNILPISKEALAHCDEYFTLMHLFDKDSVDNNKFTRTHCGYIFDVFARDVKPFYVGAAQLDPYIARLCRAVNEIGVSTCMSCDGWHETDYFYSEMCLYMVDRYSVMWFWLITEYIFGEEWRERRRRNADWTNIWEPFSFEAAMGIYDDRDMMKCVYEIRDKKEAEKVFEKNLTYASFLEEHKDELLYIRKRIIEDIYKKIENGTIDDVDYMGFLRLRRHMYETFAPLAQPLIEEFRNSYPDIIKANSYGN